MGRPGVLQFMGLQIVGHDWATELNWTESVKIPREAMKIIDIESLTSKEVEGKKQDMKMVRKRNKTGNSRRKYRKQ